MDEINIGPKHDFRLPSRRWLVLAGAVALVAATATLIVTVGGARPVPRSQGPSSAATSPNSPNPAHWTATVRARIPLPVSLSTDVAVLGSTAWVADWYTGKVVRVDLAMTRVTKILHIGRPRVGPISIAAGAGSLWVLDFSAGRVLRIAPATGAVISRIQIRGEATDVAYGDGFVWVLGDALFNGTARMALYKIRPSRNAVVRVAPVPGEGPGCVASPGPQGVWVGCGGDPGISLIDPASMKVVRSSPVNPGEYTPQIAPGQRVVWVLTSAGLIRVDPDTGKITATVQTAWDPEADAIPALAVDSSGRVWVAGSPLNVLVPGSLNTNLVGHAAGVTNVMVSRSNLWVDTGTTLVELDVSPPPFGSASG
jgi:sugar lactone lactonase YvrE